MSEQPTEEKKDGRFKETVSPEWARISADPERKAAYMARKKRYNERVKSGEVIPKKRGIMFMTAVKKTSTRQAIISEVINKLYTVEWTPTEIPKVWNLLKTFHELEFDQKK